jgi:hypothetical protein
MTDDKGIRDDESDRDRTEQDDPTTTRRAARQSSEEEERVHETNHEAPSAASGGIVSIQHYDQTHRFGTRTIPGP